MGEPWGAGISARDLGVRGPRGWVFRAVSFDAEPGSLVAVDGPSGSGRTCLLLAITGRMRPADGTTAVGGLPLPRRMAAVRRFTAPAHMAGVTDLEPALTVGEHLRERALLQRRFGDAPRGVLRGLLRSPAERARTGRERITAALDAAGLDTAALPKGTRTAVRDLERLEALRLSVALALVGRPRLLAVDDVGLKLSDADRDRAWALLADLAAAGTTVVAAGTGAPEGTPVVRLGDDDGTAHGSGDSHDSHGSGDSGDSGDSGGSGGSGDLDASDGSHGSFDSFDPDESPEKGPARASAEARRA